MNHKRKALIVILIISCILVRFAIIGAQVFLVYSIVLPYGKVLSLDPDVDDDCVIVVDDEVYKGDESFYFDTAKIYLEEVLAVRNGTIYYVKEYKKSDNSEKAWGIYSIGMNGEDQNNVYLSDLFYNTPSLSIYNDPVSAPYEERCAYYHDNKIILNDRTTVLTYDLSSGKVETKPYAEYSFPNQSAKIESGDGKPYLILDGKEISLSPDDMTLGKSAEKLFSWKNEKTWNGKSKFEDFFKCAQEINGEVYLIGQYRNFNGDAFCVVLRYDRTANRFDFVRAIATKRDHVDASDCYIAG